MQKFKQFKRAWLGLLLMALFSAPSLVDASTIYFKTVSPVNVGEKVIVEVRLKTTKALNAVEGIIRLNSEYSISAPEISTGGSVFSLWPAFPAYHLNDDTIHFAGGALATIPASSDSLLFRFSFIPSAQDDYLVRSERAVSYLADGKGTADQIQDSRIEVKVGGSRSEVRAVSEATDRDPPTLEAVIGQDQTLFGGLHFVSFFGEDAGSGISHYEVAEGWGSYRRAVSPYVLKDQALSSRVMVRAVDNAGNKFSLLVSGSPIISVGRILLATLLLLIIIVVYLSYARYRKVK